MGHVDGKCTTFYPKDLRNETTIDSNDYPIYRRRDNKRTILLKEIEIDNKFFLSYFLKLVELNNVSYYSITLTYVYYISNF